MNFVSEETRRNPFPDYERMRESAPVFQDPHTGMWMIFDYDGVKRALNENEEFSSNLWATANQPTPQWLIFFDPPRHTKLRALIMRAFTPRMVAGLEPRIRQLSGELLDRLGDGEQIDLAAGYSVPLPLMVIAEMIGVPASDWPRFRCWSDIILRLSFTGFDSEEVQRIRGEYSAMTEEMKTYLPLLIAQRRAAPADDLLTRLVEAEVDGERLSEDEILAFVQLLLVGGNETTANLINNAVLCFIENPDQLGRLRASPELLAPAIEEVLRYRSPFQYTYRATRRDVEISGRVIAAGKIVLAVIGSANYDPRVFAAPERFDIAREPNPHLAFGRGIHFCLGAALTRLEARVALADLLSRFERFELANNEPWQPRKALHVHGPAQLWLAGTARSCTASASRGEVARLTSFRSRPWGFRNGRPSRPANYRTWLRTSTCSKLELTSEIQIVRL
ncbi:MAG TPA: cytochrome P450 [Bryobacteraceae bacterium]|nr:cytochrome P450 [Bryobacteraceae bacterium]